MEGRGPSKCASLMNADVPIVHIIDLLVKSPSPSKGMKELEREPQNREPQECSRNTTGIRLPGSFYSYYIPLYYWVACLGSQSTPVKVGLGRHSHGFGSVVVV